MVRKAFLVLGCILLLLSSSANASLPSRVTFRTDIENFSYNNFKGEIAIDFDNDGNLECFKYKTFYKSWYRTKQPLLAITSADQKIFKYRNDRIILDYSKHPIYVLSTDCEIPLSTELTEPFASNNQEKYHPDINRDGVVDSSELGWFILLWKLRYVSMNEVLLMTSLWKAGI